MEIQDVQALIVGDGAARHTAARYAGRTGLEEIADEVERFPGHRYRLSGKKPRANLQKPTKGSARRIVFQDGSELAVSPASPAVNPVTRETGAGVPPVAAGDWAGRLEFEPQQRLQSGGVSARATCPGALSRGTCEVLAAAGDTLLEDEEVDFARSSAVNTGPDDDFVTGVRVGEADSVEEVEEAELLGRCTLHYRGATAEYASVRRPARTGGSRSVRVGPARD